MRKLFVGVLGLLALQAPAFAATTPVAACSSALATVTADWRAASFPAPAKPAQARVLGLTGHETSGPGYRQMTQAIRQAEAACRVGDQATALQSAGVAEALLQHGRDGV